MTRDQAINLLERAISHFVEAESGYPIPEYADTVWILRQCKWSLETERAKEQMW